MRFPAFDDGLLTGYAAIDEQHRWLFALADRVASTLGSCWIDEEHRTAIAEVCEPRVEDALADAVFGLTDYITEHFADESELMRGCGYPAAPVHEALHSELSTKVAGYTARFINQDDLAAGELLDFFADWLTSHILVHDRAFAEWIVGAEDV